MNLLLYEELPLRSSRMLGDYAEDSPLPHVLGDLSASRFPLVRLSPTIGLAADHAMEITAAFTGTEQTSSYEARVEADVLGHTVTVVEFGSPVPDELMMSASGKGKRDPRTGALLENPGELLDYVAALAGRDDEFQGLKEECSAAGIRLAGRVATRQSIRATYDDIMQSAGAIWCPGMSRRYPVATIRGAVLPLGKQIAGIETVTATIQDTADILRISFDVSDATEMPRQYLELSASPQRFGGVVKELLLAWVRSAHTAVEVGTPILQRLSGERYNIVATSGGQDVKPGQWVRFVKHPQWPIPGPDPVVMVTAASAMPRASTVNFEGETLLTTPRVRVTGHSVALPDISAGMLEVSERDGIVTFTVYDADRRPVPGAQVSLNGGLAQTSNGQGQVSFLYTPGAYEIIIEAPGQQSQTLTLTL